MPSTFTGLSSVTSFTMPFLVFCASRASLPSRGSGLVYIACNATARTPIARRIMTALKMAFLLGKFDVLNRLRERVRYEGGDDNVRKIQREILHDRLSGHEAVHYEEERVEGVVSADEHEEFHR